MIMDYLDKALKMIETPAFKYLTEGKITWDEYVKIRNKVHVPFVPVVIEGTKTSTTY